MAPSVKPATGAIGAVVDGVDLHHALDDATAQQLREALHEHSVLFFHDQDLTEDEQLGFAATFGPVGQYPLTKMFGGTAMSSTIEDTADRYLELGVEEVVVKDGAGEALIATAGERVRVAPKPGANVVDATGAGDSFNGAYLSARLAGQSLREAAEEGHRVAGVVIGQKGALVDPKLLLK
jgi:sugar/nucleoside kinase (ribokinase family)